MKHLMSEIRVARWQEIDAIREGLRERPSTMHIRRLHHQQRGHGLYLIGWTAKTAMAHVFLRWSGWPERPGTVEFQARYRCSFVEDLWVHPDNRGSGFGRALMESAHSHTQDQGITSIGLCVGLDKGYDTARHLYRSLGYGDPGHGVHIESAPGWFDRVVFLLKQLPPQ